MEQQRALRVGGIGATGHPSIVWSARFVRVCWAFPQSWPKFGLAGVIGCHAAVRPTYTSRRMGTPPKTMSEADRASEKFGQFLAAKPGFTRASADLSETDTRAKLIDPIFKDVLGWFESDIRREEPAADGYADYVLGAEYPYLHIEAKRSNPRFSIEAPSGDRYLKLTGPHLLGRKDLKPHLEQAAKYSFELGTEFAVLTNGDQFIIFQTHIRGKSWREGYAIVWHGLDDIKDDFAPFFALLSADRVRAGSLQEAFASVAGITAPLYTPLEFVRNHDAELVRNRFWNRIARVVGPLLTDDPQFEEVQEEIIRHCYVRTPLSDEVDQAIDRLLKDAPTSQLTDAGVVDLKPGMGGRTAFDLRIEDDVKGGRPGTYIITGGVGSGKTTFLRRFEKVFAASFVQHWCVWLHIDFLPLGDVTDATLEQELNRHAFQSIRDLLERDYPDVWPGDGAKLREVFAKQIADARLTVLHGVEPESERWVGLVNELVHSLFTDTPTLVEAILRNYAAKGRRVVIVMDNTDQLGEEFQAAVFLLSQRLAKSCNALTIVSLREEKFFAAYRRNVFDAYGDHRFHIGSPNLEDVLRRRLDYALQKFLADAAPKAKTKAAKRDVEEVEAVIKAFIRSATKRNQNIIRLLSCLSNGDMRYALGMFREFVSSGNTDIEKIINIVNTDGGYSVPFHEFAKSAILGARRYYRNNLSHVINVFLKSAAPGASHLTGIRILARLSNAAAVQSAHGEGFVDVGQLLGEFRQSFGRAEDFIARGDELVARGLLESEPPRVRRVQHADALRISASGLYYFKYLIRSFAYVDLMFVDTPVADRELATRLAGLAQSPKGDFAARFERVEAFLDFMSQEEQAELHPALVDGPYAEPLMWSIIEQVDSEIGLIKSKRGLDDQ